MNSKVLLSLAVIIIACILFFLYTTFFPDLEREKSTIPTNTLITESKQVSDSQNAQRRTVVDISYSKPVTSEKEIEVSFTVKDPKSGVTISEFETYNGRKFDLIILDSTLRYFRHVYPEYDGEKFKQTVTFPKDGVYYLYTEFLPTEFGEQQLAFVVEVGERKVQEVPHQILDSTFQKDVGENTVSLTFPDPLVAQEMTIGEQTLTFSVVNTKTGEPLISRPNVAVTMVMINASTYHYIHIHPHVEQNQQGGPLFLFSPTVLSKPIRPGIYRVFFEFYPEDQVSSVDFTVEVK